MSGGETSQPGGARGEWSGNTVPGQRRDREGKAARVAEGGASPVSLTRESRSQGRGEAKAGEKAECG